MVLLHGTLDVVIHEATDLPLSLANQVWLWWFGARRVAQPTHAHELRGALETATRLGSSCCSRRRLLA
jgi:hypothetical protein